MPTGIPVTPSTAITGTQLQDKVDRIVGEGIALGITDAQWIDVLNQAQNDVAKDSRCLLGEIVLDSVVGHKAIDRPSGLMDVVEVFYDGVPLQVLDIRGFESVAYGWRKYHYHYTTADCVDGGTDSTWTLSAYPAFDPDGMTLYSGSFSSPIESVSDPDVVCEDSHANGSSLSICISDETGLGTPTHYMLNGIIHERSIVLHPTPNQGGKVMVIVGHCLPRQFASPLADCLLDIPEPYVGLVVQRGVWHAANLMLSDPTASAKMAIASHAYDKLVDALLGQDAWPAGLSIQKGSGSYEQSWPPRTRYVGV